jgi:peroxiredoxin
LRQSYPQFVARESELLVIAPDNHNALNRYWTQNDMPFPGLPDESHRVADLYAQEVNWLKLGRMPELVVVDRSGQIRYRHHAGSMSDIPAPGVLLAVIDSVCGETVKPPVEDSPCP